MNPHDLFLALRRLIGVWKLVEASDLSVPLFDVSSGASRTGLTAATSYTNHLVASARLAPGQRAVYVYAGAFQPRAIACRGQDMSEGSNSPDDFARAMEGRKSSAPRPSYGDGNPARVLGVMFLLIGGFLSYDCIYKPIMDVLAQQPEVSLQFKYILVAPLMLAFGAALTLFGGHAVDVIDPAPGGNPYMLAFRAVATAVAVGVPLAVLWFMHSRGYSG